MTETTNDALLGARRSSEQRRGWFEDCRFLQFTNGQAREKLATGEIDRRNGTVDGRGDGRGGYTPRTEAGAQETQHWTTRPMSTQLDPLALRVSGPSKI